MYIALENEALVLGRVILIEWLEQYQLVGSWVVDSKEVETIF